VVLESSLRGTRVLVAGAGMAGLVAARQLERRGAAVTLIEARNRVGGRVWTIREGFAAGQHAEAGGDLIEGEHRATLALAEELGLHPVRILRQGFGFFGASPDGTTCIQSMAHGFSAMREPLQKLIADYHHAERRWDGALARHWGHLSVADWLAAEHAPEWTAQRFRGLRGLFLAEPEELSLLALIDFFADGAVGGGEMFRIREGNDRLATGVADLLQSPPRFRTVLERVEQSATGVVATVETSIGRSEIAADFAVVTIPASLLWSIDFAPALPESQLDAFARIRTGCATKLLLQFARRFWPTHGQPRAFGTDRPYGALWDANEGQRGGAAILSLLGGGRAAAQLRSMVNDGSAQSVADELAWLGDPSPLVNSRLISWDDDEWARGGYAYFHTDFDPHLRDWLARPAGRIVFAGEHTSIQWQGYINGAIESGERAAAEIAALHAESVSNPGAAHGGDAGHGETVGTELN
jgi:monoamine oxidase